MKRNLHIRILAIIVVISACLCLVANGERAGSLVQWWVGDVDIREFFGEIAGGHESVPNLADITDNNICIGEALLALSWKFNSYADYSNVLDIILRQTHSEMPGFYYEGYTLELLESELYGWGRSSYGAAECCEYYVVRINRADGYWEDVCICVIRYSEDNIIYLSMVCANAPRESLDPPSQDEDDYNPGDYSDFGEYMGDMYVANCEEWVSLRAEMNTSSARLAKVPLGTLLEGVYFWTDEFAYCTYNGMDGFILTRYLSYEKPIVHNHREEPSYYAGNGTTVIKGLGGRTLARNDRLIHLFDYSATSHLIEPSRTYPADNLFDGNYDNAWSDGVQGEGVGEIIRVTWSAGGDIYEAQGLAFRNGYQKTEGIYKKNSRPKDVTIRIYDHEFTGRLMDTRDGWQSIIFDKPLVFDCEIGVEIEIDSVYPGTKYQDTCITEIDLLVYDVP